MRDSCDARFHTRTKPPVRSSESGLHDSPSRRLFSLKIENGWSVTDDKDSRMLKMRMNLNGALVAALMMLCGGVEANAATLTVSSLANSGTGTLRAQVAAAAPGDTIDFSVTGTITLTTFMDIGKDLTITGPGAGNLSLNGNAQTRMFRINSGVVRISGLTLTNGSANSQSVGGVNVIRGGTINLVGGALTLTSCILSDSSARHGGGIYVGGGSLTISSSTLSGSSDGSGIYMGGGSLLMTDSTVSGNLAGESGGGVFLNTNATATVKNSTVSGNSARGQFGGGGGFFNHGNLTITQSTISGNSTTAFRPDAGVDGGGGIYNFGVLTVTASTISANTAYHGGGIHTSSNPLTMSNSIVAGNTAHRFAPDLLGSVSAGDYNLVQNMQNTPGLGLSGTNNVTGQSPLLGALANNGGPTLTHALLAGSPAIDTGDPNFDISNLPYDQRGVGYTRKSGTRIDIGAFELQQAPAITSITPASGPSTGGTVVTINGSNFVVGGTSVSFGGVAATGVNCSSTSTCVATSPAGTGVVNVLVTTTGGTSANTSADDFTFIQVPTVTSIAPTSGPTGGGTVVTITGTNFAVGGTTVTFGGVAAAAVNCSSTTTCTATSPSGAGVVNVLVTTAGGTSANTAADDFTFIPVPAVTSITPTSGPSSGETLVTINGSNFIIGATTVSFGGVAATGVNCTSTTTCTATSPAGTGVVNVLVTTAGGTSANTAVDDFTFIGAPAVTSITPTSGPSSGGTVVTITGSNFIIGGTTVSFGGVAETGVNCSSTTTCTATSPAGAGVVDVLVTTASGTSANTPADDFTFSAAASTVPGAPTIGAATPGNGQASIAFTPPGSDGGSPITSYTVTCNPGAIAATGAASPITVTGLANGTTHTCSVTATNTVGTSAPSQTVSVTPAIVPGAPLIGTASPGDGQASIAFSPPGSNGGSAITSYTVTCNPNGITASGAASPIIVTGLTNGIAYDCSVTATNAVGTSAPSQTVSVTPAAAATVPGAPTIGAATPGNGQASIAFTAPGSNGGSPITSYTVTCNPNGITASGAASPITVTGLTNGTTHTCSVTATNAVGPSAPSQTVSVTPMAPSVAIFGNGFEGP